MHTLCFFFFFYDNHRLGAFWPENKLPQLMKHKHGWAWITDSSLNPRRISNSYYILKACFMFILKPSLVKTCCCFKYFFISYHLCNVWVNESSITADALCPVFHYHYYFCLQRKEADALSMSAKDIYNLGKTASFKMAGSESQAGCKTPISELQLRRSDEASGFLA